jgi:hypothetical protein
LKVSEYPELCEEFMGQFPVISISLKGVEGTCFEEAETMLIETICAEYSRHEYLLESDKLNEFDKKDVFNYMCKNRDTIVIRNSLFTLSKLLYKHYGKKVVVLIDEYDVPLDKANSHGYYEEMVSFIRGMFGQVLKSNDNLYFAVLTGCLRVSKESIFTGLNNLDVYPITDVRLCEYFGFTNDEVKTMLAYYNLSEHFETMKSWYDGYRFGDMDVYCPWDVIKYCNALRVRATAKPESYWINTSGNDVIQSFLSLANATTKDEIEQLIAGNTISKEIHQELTYKDINTTIDNLWSILFTTGYLTMRGEPDDDIVALAIPNLGIRKIFVNQIYQWFKSYSRLDTDKLQFFCNAFLTGNAKMAQELFNEYLRKTISVRDTNVPFAKKENFYHGILLGLLSYMENCKVKSNLESGDGFSDIVIENPDTQVGIVIEVKYGENEDLDGGCKQALDQIEKMRYTDILVDDGMTKILKYGVACYKKQCKIVLA